MRMIKRVYLSACLLVLTVVMTLSGSAQETTGGITGRTVDSLGKPVADATVTALHTLSGTRYTTRSGADGRYHLPNMRIGGPYTLTVTLVGIATFIQTDLQVSLGSAQVLDIVLQEQSQQLSGVVVKANAAGRNRADRFGAGVSISRERILNQPTISRSLTDMTKMVPQASKDNSFGGSNFRYNNVTIDGAINNDAIGFSPSAGGQSGTSGMPGSSTRTNPVSMDAIEDVQVYLAPYDVKIGNFTGGSVNAVTRSGTNKVTGSVYIYGRNASLTGKENAGDKSKMPSSFHELQTGFRIGFPIVKNKLFFFTNEEVTDRTDPVTQGASSPDVARVIDEATAKTIKDFLMNNYHYDPGTYGNFDTYARSQKLFNRLDWNINDKHQLAIRNNLVFSKSTNLERDELEFRFSDIAYQQVNNQNATVAELKSRFSNKVSNSLVIGYSTIHDYRNPNNPAFPQVQIQGKTPGTTIYLGTDREASIFNMKQRTTEITDNVTLYHGKHTFLFGTHNELYNIQYGFVNSWNGRVDYQDNPAANQTALETLLNGKPARVRGAYNFVNNTRDYLMANPSALFHVNFYSIYAQDEVQVSSRFRLTAGLRLDYTAVPTKPVISYRMENAAIDARPDSSFDFTPLNQINNKYLSKLSASPRVGFNWNALGKNELVLRGGVGIFTGRIPFAWMGYSFYNNGDTYGYYDQRATNTAFVNGSSVLNAPSNGIAAFAQANGQNVNNKYIGATQVDVIDNSFKMPRVVRSSLALDYQKDGWKLTLEGIYTKTIYDVKFTQINYKGTYAYYGYDTASHLQPIYTGTVDPNLAAAYQLGNTTKGYRYTITSQVSKQTQNGLYFSAAYTYGQAKDISNGIRNSMESNWQLNQALNPNNPGLAWSNFDVRHRLNGSVSYRKAWNEQWVSRFSLYMQAQSGSPYTWGFVNATVQNNAQQVSLAYIPYADEAIKFFQDVYDKGGQLVQSRQSQADAFNAFIGRNGYLTSRRGNYTERNMGRTPWNVTADFQFIQELHLKNTHVISLTWSIMNLTNLINKEWGWTYFSPNTFNSTASVGLTPYIPNRVSGTYPQYTFQDPGKPYSVDFYNSRWQMQLGLRYSF